MLVALATLLVCAFMFAIYGIVRFEERRLESDLREPPQRHASRWRRVHLSFARMVLSQQLRQHFSRLSQVGFTENRGIGRRLQPHVDGARPGAGAGRETGGRFHHA